MGQSSNRQMDVGPGSWDDMTSLIPNGQGDEHGFTVQPVTGGPPPRRIGGTTTARTNADRGEDRFSDPNKLSGPLDNTDDHGGHESRAGRSIQQHDSVRDERLKLPTDYSGDRAHQDPSQLAQGDSGESTNPDDLDDLEALWDIADQEILEDTSDEDALGDVDDEEWDHWCPENEDHQEGTSGSSIQVNPTPSQIARIAHLLPFPHLLNRGPSCRRRRHRDPSKVLNWKEWKSQQKPGWREHSMWKGPTVLRQIWLPGMVADPESEALSLKKPAWMLWP